MTWKEALQPATRRRALVISREGWLVPRLVRRMVASGRKLPELTGLQLGDFAYRGPRFTNQCRNPEDLLTLKRMKSIGEAVLPLRICHSCGLRSSACTGAGFATKIRSRAENKFRRDRKITVWCCSRGCAIQANAIADMGPASHKWPVTLAQYSAQTAGLLDIRQIGSDRTETIVETSADTGHAEAENQVLDPEPAEAVSVRNIRLRRGGRPRKWRSEAERLRAYRARKRDEADSSVQRPCRREACGRTGSKLRGLTVQEGIHGSRRLQAIHEGQPQT